MKENVRESKFIEYETRLEKLERRNRFLTLTCVFALFLPLLSLVAWKETHNTGNHVAGAITRLENGEPVLRFWDKNLSTRIRMGIIRNEPVLIFYDRFGKVRARIGLQNDVPGFVMYDSKGNPVTILPTQ